jgi:phytoene dehydrogenase-like protein
MQDGQVEAIVVGAGPNGLAAAITLARAGRSVRVYEAAPEAGGRTRTMELTLPGFRHDICSTILPLTVASPFFATIDLAARGVDLIHPDAPVAHPLDGGRAVVLERSVAATAAALGGPDGRAWRRKRTLSIKDESDFRKDDLAARWIQKAEAKIAAEKASPPRASHLEPGPQTLAGSFVVAGLVGTVAGGAAGAAVCVAPFAWNYHAQWVPSRNLGIAARGAHRVGRAISLNKG